MAGKKGGILGMPLTGVGLSNGKLGMNIRWNGNGFPSEICEPTRDQYIATRHVMNEIFGRMRWIAYLLKILWVDGSIDERTIDVVSHQTLMVT